MTQPMAQSSTESGAQAQTQTGPELHRQAEHLAEEARELWHKIAAESRKPSVGALIAGVAVLAAGAVWGATEAAVAAVAAYAVFRMLRRRVDRRDKTGRGRAETEARDEATERERIAENV